MRVSGSLGKASRHRPRRGPQQIPAPLGYTLCPPASVPTHCLGRHSHRAPPSPRGAGPASRAPAARLLSRPPPAPPLARASGAERSPAGPDRRWMFAFAAVRPAKPVSSSGQRGGGPGRRGSHGGGGTEAAAPGSGGWPGRAAGRLLPAGQVGARRRAELNHSPAT